MGKGRTRRKGALRAKYEEYPLSGKLKCSCGSTITGVTRGGRREYVHGKAQIKDGACSLAVPSIAIEEDVFAQLSQILRSRDLPQLILRSQQAADRGIDFDALIERQRRELERIEKERSELIRLKARMKEIDPRTLRTFGNDLSKFSSEQTVLEAKLAELEQERAEVRHRKTRAQEAADVLAYLAADSRRWTDRNNQRTLLDACFGIGNLKAKEPGIYVTKKAKRNGRCDYIPRYRFAVDVDQAVQVLAGQIKPGELGRPFLPSKRIWGKEPNVITSIST